jgi:hypothetical protein
MVDGEAMQAALRDPDTLAGIRAVAPRALGGEAAGPAMGPQYLRGHDGAAAVPTLGQWGDAGRR